MTAVTRSGLVTSRQVSGNELAERLAALEEQRRFRVEQLRELADETARRPATTRDEPRDEVLHALGVAGRTALLEIEAALRRMETGTYGRCEGCHGDIPSERLEILPMVALCMACAHARQQYRR